MGVVTLNALLKNKELSFIITGNVQLNIMKMGEFRHKLICSYLNFNLKSFFLFVCNVKHICMFAG